MVATALHSFFFIMAQTGKFVNRIPEKDETGGENIVYKEWSDIYFFSKSWYNTCNFRE